MTSDRRTVLARLAAMGATTAVGGLAGCLDDGGFGPVSDGGGGDGGGADDGDGDGGDGNDGGNDGTLPPLAAGTEIGVVSTKFLGEYNRPRADPDEPNGGMLVTVRDLEPGERVTVSWRRTVEREVTPDTPTTTVGVGTTTATPEVETVALSGTVTASGLADAHEPLLPIYWGDEEEITTDTSAMWLSREAYRELRDTRETLWSRDVLTRLSRLPEEVLERVRDGANELDEVSLHADPEFVDFDLFAGDRKVTVSAIRAYDDFGNEYVVLADEDNPLIVRFTFDARSTGFTGFDTAVWVVIKSVYSGYQVTGMDGARRAH